MRIKKENSIVIAMTMVLLFGVINDSSFIKATKKPVIAKSVLVKSGKTFTIQIKNAGFLDKVRKWKVGNNKLIKLQNQTAKKAVVKGMKTVTALYKL